MLSIFFVLSFVAVSATKLHENCDELYKGFKLKWNRKYADQEDQLRYYHFNPHFNTLTVKSLSTILPIISIILFSIHTNSSFFLDFRNSVFCANMLKADKLNELNGSPSFGVSKFADRTDEG